MYAFHWYTPPSTTNLTEYLDDRIADAARLNAVAFASEWNFGASDPASAETFFDNVAAFESRRLAYAGWQYKTYQAGLAGGTCTGCGSAFFYPNGSVIPYTLDGISAPFAQVVAGRVTAISVTPLRTAPDARKYELKYVAIGTAGAVTEVLVSSMWLSHTELDVQVVAAGAKVHVEMISVDGARLSAGVTVPPSARVKVQHDVKAGTDVTLILTSKK